MEGLSDHSGICVLEGKNGGPSTLASHPTVPQLQLIVNKDFITTPLYKNESFLKEKYLEEDLSLAQIAALIGSSKEAVRSGLNLFDIPIREAHLPHGRPAQPKFGRKIQNGSEINFIREQRVIDAVTEMKGQGLSLRQIAKVLDQMKIPTKCRGKSWHPQMVKRILNF